MKPADPGRLCLGEFQITDSMPVLVIGLFLFPFSSWFWFGLGRLHISKSLSIPSRWSILWACSQGPLEGSPDPAMLLSAAAGPSPLTVCPLAPTAPSVAPSGLSGGGGAPGELTVTWTVSSEDRGRNMPALLWEGGSPRPAAHPAPGTHLRRGAACREGPTGPLRGPDSGSMCFNLASSLNVGPFIPLLSLAAVMSHRPLCRLSFLPGCASFSS